MGFRFCTKSRNLGRRNGWLRITLRLLLAVYLSLSIPFRVAFIPTFTVHTKFFLFVALDLISTIFFVIETIIALPSSSPSASSSVVPVTDSRKAFISRNASMIGGGQRRPKWWDFSLSLLATVPFEYATIIWEHDKTNYFLMNRALRMFYLPSYLSDISRILEEKDLLRNICVDRAWKLFFAMAIAGHWCGCGFFFVARDQALKGNPMTWPQDIGIYTILSEGHSNNVSLMFLKDTPEAYILSLYWAYITMITTGFGDIVPLTIQETLWCIMSMYIGVVITACAIANLQLLVTNMDAALTFFQRKIELIKRYMHYRRLPNSLQKRIMSFYDYQWDLLKGADEEKFLVELPRSLQQQITNVLYRDLIGSLPVLRKANNALLNALADCTEVNIYSPRDDVLKPGEQLRGAILISRGEVEVLRGTIIERKMQRFDRFAEESLFVTKICNFLVRSKTFAEVFLLPAVEFQHIIHSQCDNIHISYMKETALALAKSSVKANKLFGSAEDTTPSGGFKKHCHPYSSFRKFWDCVVFLCLTYYVIAIPLNAMRIFSQSEFRDVAVLLILGYIVDLFCAINAILKFNFFMYMEEGLVVFDRECIRRKFRTQHNVFLELFSLLPVDFLAIWFGSRYYNAFRLTKICRLPSVLNYLGRIERLLTESKIGLDQSLRRVINLNFLMIVVCHWVGCAWYIVADIGTEVLSYDESWRDADEQDESLSISHTDLGGFSGYLRSVYWAIVGMSTVGYGDIVPTNALETTFSTFIILFGGLVLPAVVGGLAAYMGSMNIATKFHKRKVAKIRSYLKKQNIEKSILDRILRYYHYLWARQGGVDEQNIMDELPGPLRQRVATFVNGDAISCVPFFALCDNTTRELIVSTLKPRVFLPNDVITQQGELGKEMFFIERGEVVVSSMDNIPFCTLSRGDYFGESCLIGATVRVATVRALTYCDCFVLSNDDFREVIENYFSPERKNITNAVAETIRSKSRRNSSISRNIIEHPKCQRNTTGEGSDLTEIVAKRSRNAKIQPDSKLKSAWSIILLTVCVYNAWSIPFRLAFMSSSYYIIDWTLDIIFVSDMFLNYMHFSHFQEGELISETEKVKRHYMKGNFKVDVLSTLPFDIIAYIWLKNDARLTAAVAVLRLPKLLRLCRLLQIMGDIFRFLEDLHMNLAPLRLVEFLSGVILIAHWACCGFYALARLKNSHVNCDGLDTGGDVITWGTAFAECRWENTWVQKQIMNGKLPVDGGEPWQLYIRSFNWALPTLAVVVIGDVVPMTSEETLYAFGWMVVGVTINAAIIGNVANIVANLESESAEFITKTDEVKQFLHKHHISHDLQQRVDLFMTYLWTAHGGVVDEDGFVNELPCTLQNAVTGQTRLHYVKDCPFFDFCSNDIIKALAIRLKPKIFSIGDELAYVGDIGQEMFFIDKGSVEVMSSDGKTVFATLVKGAFFGETSLFFKTKRTSTVRAISFCEVFQLDKCDIDDELRQRNFDLSRMLDTFNSIANSNKRRNAAVAANLEASKMKQNKLYKMIDQSDSMNVSAIKTRRIFLPHSVFRCHWDIACMLFSLYFATSILYRVAFVLEEDISYYRRWLLVDFSIDIFFIVDVYFRYTRFAFVYNGTVVINRNSIARHYRKNGMLLDVFSCLPLDVIVLLIPGLKDSVFLFRLVHLIRVRRLPSYLNHIEGYLNGWNIRVSAAMSLLSKTFFYYVLVNHLCACIWFLIHRYLERNIKYTWATTDCVEGGDDAGEGCLATWDDEMGQHNICNNGYVTNCYIRSIYFVITTISTVGYGMYRWN